MSPNVSRRLVVLLVPLVGLLAACERTPEDVEKWRNAEKGMEKMQTWASSPDEPMPVRVRAVRIMIEEGRTPLLVSTFEEVDSDSARADIAAGVVPRVEEMWKTHDYPTLDSGESKSGSKRVEVGPSKSIKAKDAAYYLQPHAKGETQKTLESILAEWLSQDWKLRNKLGNVTLGQALPRSGDEGLQNAMTWLEKTDQPGDVASTLRRKSDEETKIQIAKVILERARAAHPELSTSLKRAVVETRQDPIVDYLKKVIHSSDSSPKFVDGAMDAFKEIRGERATGFFAELIEKKSGPLRWAAVNDLIQIRGKGGILSSAVALPLERRAYSDDSDDRFKQDVEWFGSFTVTNMQDEDVSSLSGTIVRMIESDRWPARAMALSVIQQVHAAEATELIETDREDLVETVEGLTSSRDRLPNWGERMTLGEYAHQTLDLLTS